MEYFGEENLSEILLIAFAQFEERQKEHERARVIFRLFSVKLILYLFLLTSTYRKVVLFSCFSLTVLNMIG